MNWSDLIASETGKVSESRVWGHVGKAAIVYLIVRHSDVVVANWESAFVLTSMLVAPELLKRWLALRTKHDDNA